MTKKYRLPKTHHDLLVQHSPTLVDAARTDADRLKGSFESVLRIDDIQTQHRAIVDSAKDDVIREHAERYGRDFEELKLECAEDPETIAFLNRIGAFTSLHYQVSLNYHLSGRKVFYLSENLTDQLAETELNFPAEDIQTPFPTCLFVLQGETARDLLRKLIPNGNTIKEMAEPNIPISVYVTIGQSSEFPDSRVLVIAAWMADPDSNRQIAMAKRDLMLQPGWSIEQALKTDWNDERRKRDLAEIDGASVNHSDNGMFTSSSSDEMFYTDGLQFYRLVVNAILYLMSDAAEQRSMRPTRTDLLEVAENEPKPKRQREKERFAERFSDSPYVLLGEMVGEIEDRSRGSGNRSAKRIMVRGHYKKQAHGAGHTLRKHIWVRPHYRGPDMAELVSKPYVVR